MLRRTLAALEATFLLVLSDFAMEAFLTMRPPDGRPTVRDNGTFAFRAKLHAAGAEVGCQQPIDT